MCRYEQVLIIVVKLTFSNIDMKKVIALGVLFAPFIASAQIAAGAGNVSKLIAFLKDLLSTATTLILAAAVVYFLWNVFKFVMSAGDEEARAKGQQGIIYGVIGIAVMVSIWGLVNFLTSTAGLETTTRSAPSLSL